MTATLIVPSSVSAPPTLTRSFSGPPATFDWPNSKSSTEAAARVRFPPIVRVPGLLPGASPPFVTATFPPMVPEPPRTPLLLTATELVAPPRVPSTCSAPPETVVVPVKAALVPVRCVTPATWLIAPAPLITGLNV